MGVSANVWIDVRYFISIFSPDIELWELGKDILSWLIRKYITMNQEKEKLSKGNG